MPVFSAKVYLSLFNYPFLSSGTSKGGWWQGTSVRIFIFYFIFYIPDFS